jgi:hypothetical protein
MADSSRRPSNPARHLACVDAGVNDGAPHLCCRKILRRASPKALRVVNCELRELPGRARGGFAVTRGSNRRHLRRAGGPTNAAPAYRVRRVVSEIEKVSIYGAREHVSETHRHRGGAAANRVADGSNGSG